MPGLAERKKAQDAQSNMRNQSTLGPMDPTAITTDPIMADRRAGLMRQPVQPNIIASPISDIKNRQIPTLELGEGAGTNRISGAGKSIQGVPQAKVTTSKYAGPSEAASYVQNLQKSLGITGPKSTIDATRAAATRTLDEQAYNAAIQGQQQLAAQGQTTGARSQALSALRGTELAGQKAQLEAQLQGQEAQQMQAYEQALLGAGLRQGEALTSADQEAARALTQGSQFNTNQQAARELAQAEMALTSGKALNAEEYQRRMSEYGNALAKIQQQNTGDILQIQDDAARRAAIMDIFGSLIGGGARIGAAAL